MPKYRKFLSAVFLLCLTAGIASAAPAEKKNKLPILESEAALELAYQHNPVLRAAAERIDQARLQIARARADKLPHLYAQLAGEWQGKEGRMPAYGNTYGINPATGRPGLTGKTAGYSVSSFDEAYKAALGVKWLLFSNGAVENLVASRKMAYRGVKVKEIRTGQAVENAVLISYYKLQRARAKLTVAKEVLALIREHLEQVNYFYKYGVVAKDEV